MEEQNRVNKEKNINTQRQETEEVTESKELGKGAIWKVRTQGECPQTKTCWGKRCSKK